MTETQKPPMKAEPQQQHKWLEKLVGEWTYEGEAMMGPGHQPVKFSGSETGRMLGGLWLVVEGRGQMPDGGASQTMMTLGYDTRLRRIVGTWLGSMMTHMWVYNGAIDQAGRVLTLEAEGPSCTGEGTIAKYRDVIEFRGDNERVLTSAMLGDNGEWRQFMTATYRRKH